jgi:hypothetical protein
MKRLLVLFVLGIFILGCSLLPSNPATPAPTNTATRGLLIATFTSTSAEPILPTQIPTLEPITTATPIYLATATVEQTETPEIVYTSAPPTLITALSVGVSFKKPKVCPSLTTVTFTGDITIGPANFTEVEYRWVISGDASHIGTINRTNISAATTFSIHPSTYKLGCGSYTVGLQVLSPNLVTDKKSFTIP